MSSSAAFASGQPTPPDGEAELAYGLHHVAQHNSGFTAEYPDVVEPQPLGLGITYDDTFGQHDSSYGQDVYSHPSVAQSYQRNTPPTPRSNTASDSGRRTRSGRAIKRYDSPHSSIRDDSNRVSKSPRSRKNKVKAKGANPLTQPLSVLTKDMEVPVKDMDAWVNRSMEVREEEAKKRNGYVTRPMNSFMLYRSAYAERTKAFCVQNNHQVVSSVAGESWPLEPQEVRDHYNELARIERSNHQKAHPTYKFSPSKSNQSRKRKDEEVEEELFSDEDPDGDYAPSRRPAKQARREEVDQNYYVNNTYLQDPYAYAEAYANQTQNRRPLPTSYPQVDQYGQQYYQNAPQRPYSAQTAPPAQPYGAQPLVGLPTGQQQGTFGSRTQTPVQYQQYYQQHQVDPQLAAQGQYQYADPTEQQFDPNYQLQSRPDSHFDTAYGEYANPSGVDAWALDPALSGLEQETEYGSYLEQ